MGMNDRVEVWFDGFALRLVERLDRQNWLDDGVEFWDGIRSRVVHHGIREAEADAASLLLLDDPPEYRNQLWTALLRAFHAVRASHEASASAAPDDCEAARVASLGCPYCHGQGLLSVSHSRGGDPDKHCPPTLTAVCVCPAGRWHKTQVLRSLPQGRKAGMIDLAAVLDGSSAYRLAITDPGFDMLASAYWQSLPESERQLAMALVLERLGDWRELREHPGWVEGIARGWAYDPSLVAGMPPPPRDTSWKRATPQYPAGNPGRAPNVARLPGDPAAAPAGVPESPPG